MNDQWSSSAGVCVQAQSEQQRQLAVSQQSRTLAAISDASPGSSAQFQLYTRPVPPPTSASASHCTSPPGGIARPHSLLANGLPPNCAVPAPRKGEEAEQRGGCMCVPTSSKSASGSDEEASSSRKLDSIVNSAVPSTSCAVRSVDERHLSPPHSNRCSRRRLQFTLTANEAFRLRRIAESQPLTLRRLGITSVQVGDSDAIQVIVSPTTLRSQQLPRPPPVTNVAEEASTSATRVPPVYDARSANHKPSQHTLENNSGSDFRHEVMPSTSAYGPPPAKRKSYEMDGTRGPSSNATRMTAHEPCAPAHNVSTGGTSSARQPSQPSQNVNNNSPLLVNLLRSTSPGAGAGMNAPHAQAHAQRPPTTPVAPQMSTPPSQSQSSSTGFSPYPYMPRTPMAATPGGPPSVQMRPPPTSGEVQQIASSSHMHCEQQHQQAQHQAPSQQPQIMQQQMNVERQRQMMSSQQQSSQAQQVPQQGYYPPAQYPQQQRAIAPGYVLPGGAHAQQSQGVLYAPQQGQTVRAQYVHMQQQAPLAAHSLPPHYRQAAPVEQAAPQPAKKRKRPTKKQQKEAEMAQQAAAVQQQQQYMMEQQINARVPPTNAHTVDRPNMIPQMMQGGQPQAGMVYAQHPRPYAQSSMQSPSASASAASQMMQSPTTNAVYYQQQQQQQQHMWNAQQQQQMIQPQRATQMMHSQQPQMAYPPQMQQQWQSAQPHPQRVAYPQGDNGAEMGAPPPGSVHQSPAANRNNSMDFSPASQSSSTMSPLYHQQQQQQQHMMYQPQMATNQQTPPSGTVSYASQQSVSSSSQQRDPQIQQQQQHAYVHEQQQHVQQQQQQKNASLMDTPGDFGMQDDLGANIADDCGDFNDLDAIEPMTESGDVGTTLMATHQQMQQQQQHASNQQTSQQTVVARQAQQQSGYGVATQMHHVAQGYEQMVQGGASNSHQVMCGPAGAQSKCATPRQQQQQAPPGYGVQKQQHHPQQQTSPMQGYSMQQQQQAHMNAAYGVPQPCTSQSTTYSSDQISPPRQSMSAAYVARQQHQQQSQYQQQQQPNLQQHHTQQQLYQQDQQQQSMCVLRTSSAGYPPQTAQQQHRGPGSIGTPPVVHQHMPSTTRQSEDPAASQLEEGATSLGSRPESGVVTEHEKDPINSTIESVVMRALSDQDALASSASVPQNRQTVQRARVIHSVQPSSSAESTPSGKLMGAAVNSVPVKAPHITRQTSQPSVSRSTAHGQQLQQPSMTAAEGASTATSGSPRSLNGRPSSVDGRSSSSSGPTLTHQLTSITSSHIARRASTSSAGVCETGEESESSASFANGQKDRKMSDSARSVPEQRLNSANYVTQHHLTNGHDPHLLKPNGLSSCVFSDEERRALGAAQQQQQTLTVQRTPPKSAPRRNRRKADLSQEASPHRDDDDEFFLSTATSTQPMRASFTRRVSIAGGVVVGSSGTAPPQAHFGSVVSVQSAQNNFSATVARQQQHVMKHQPKTS